MSTKKSNNFLIAILGPTGSGKTDFAIKLAQRFRGEIVCADSRTIYRGMDIGTAKPATNQKIITNNQKLKNKKWNQKIITGVPHYLLDIKKPNENFTVAEFKNQAVEIIRDIQARSKIAFLVGGTGLYISALINDLNIPPVAPNFKLRKKLEAAGQKYGWGKLYSQLLRLDPKAKNFVDPQNHRRIIRALEVCLITNQPFSSLRQTGKSPFKTLQIGLNLPRTDLYQKINQRVDQMITNGLAQETKKLLKKYSPRLPAMSGIGYREIIAYLKHKIDLLEAINLIKRDTRHYAKRQLTWFKRDRRIKWLKPTDTIKAVQLIKKFILK